MVIIVVNKERARFFSSENGLLKFFMVTFNYETVQTCGTGCTSTIARGGHITICVYHFVNVMVFVFLSKLAELNDQVTIR